MPHCVPFASWREYSGPVSVYLYKMTALLRDLGTGLLEILAPSVCLACPATGAHRLGLCAACRGRLRRLWPPTCAGCGRSLAAAHAPAGYRCGSCRARGSPLHRLVAVWSYQPPLDRVVKALKFERLSFLGPELAREMLRAGLEPPAADLVAPVPLHWRRRLARGFDQAEGIARPLADALGVPWARALRRVRATPAQTRQTAGRGRRRNLRGAFRARRHAPIAGRRVLLIDDVVTTGATLEAAARALRRAGARRVEALVAARTPGPGERADCGA